MREYRKVHENLRHFINDLDAVQMEQIVMCHDSVFIIFKHLNCDTSPTRNVGFNYTFTIVIMDYGRPLIIIGLLKLLLTVCGADNEPATFRENFRNIRAVDIHHFHNFNRKYSEQK